MHPAGGVRRVARLGDGSTSGLRRTRCARSLSRLALAVALLVGGHAAAQRRQDSDRYDATFRKYSKRFFGPAFDWQYFKAQGEAESGLDPRARSRVGARGVMQLMPGTYAVIKAARHERMGAIEDPEWNIAAAILHDRDLWLGLSDHPEDAERMRFMFGSYNAGEGPIMRAKSIARASQLDATRWRSIERVAPQVQRWRYTETLPYVQKIESNYEQLRAQPTRQNAPRRGSSERPERRARG